MHPAEQGHNDLRRVECFLVVKPQYPTSALEGVLSSGHCAGEIAGVEKIVDEVMSGLESVGVVLSQQAAALFVRSLIQ
jgi:hypothetical protein